MFRHRQPLRRWAAFALLLWLFGVGAGVAHACLTLGLSAPGNGPDGSATRSEVVHEDTAVAASAGCHGAGQAHHDDGVPGKTNCQDFCDKASVSIPPLKAALDDVLGAALLFPAVAGVVPVPALAPVQAWVPRRSGVGAPPIHIAFLRLTL